MLKIILLGDSGVGKTTWLKRICNGKFIEKHNPTSIEGEKYSFTFESNHGSIEFEIFDTSGKDKREKFDNVNGAIIFCDLTKKKSFKRISYWKKKLNKNVPVILIFNKDDLKKKLWEVKLKDFLNKKGKCLYPVMTSCKKKRNLFLPLILLSTKNSEHFIWPKKNSLRVDLNVTIIYITEALKGRKMRKEIKD